MDRCPKCGHRVGDPLTPVPLLFLPHGDAFREAWVEWVRYRSEKKAKLTDTTARKQLAMLANLPEPHAVETLEASMTNGWTGLFPAKVKGFVVRGQAETNHFVDLVADTMRKRGTA